MLWLWLACAGGVDTSSDNSCNGDLDGSGTDTGNLPDLFGAWNTTLTSKVFYDTCEIDGLGRGDFPWLNGGAMTIAGRIPDRLSATFASAPGAELIGIVSSEGGTSFTGRYDYRGYELHVSLGGLPWYNSRLDADEISGAGFIGIDTDDDGNLDCGIQGDFNAKRPR